MVEFDNSSGIGSTAENFSYDLEVADNPNRLIVVGVNYFGTVGGAKDINEITYDDVALDEGEEQGFDTGVTRFYFLTSPNTGVNSVFVDTIGDSNWTSIAVSLYNVNQVSPLGTISKTGSTRADPSETVTTENGWMALDFLGLNGWRSITPGAGQTQREHFSNNDGFTTVSIWASTQPATGTSVVMDWDAINEDWRHIAIPIRSASTGGQGITWFMFENARSKWDEIFKPSGYNEPILVPEAI